MGKDKRYNGHKNWNYWNVALWIGNDEGLYNLALDLKRKAGTRKAAEAFVTDRATFPTNIVKGRSCTPDGAPWTISAVRAAIAGLVVGLDWLSRR